MGLLTRVLAPERRGKAPWDDYWYQPVGGGSTSSGVRVSVDSAMRCTTAMACIKVLSESIGSVPCKYYQRMPNGGKRLVADDQMYRLVHDAPNEVMTAMAFFETVMAHLTTYGNSYSLKNNNRRGQPLSLELFDPSKVEPKRLDNGGIEYHVRLDSGGTMVYPREQILHIPAFGWNGVRGLSPIEYAAEAIGLSLAAEAFGGRFFGSGTNAGAIVTMPEGVRLDQDEMEKFRQDFKKQHEGLGKSHKAMIVPAGMTYTNIGIPPDQAQFLETRKFQKAEIASIYRVPLHLIQEHEKSTSWGSGIDSMAIHFIQYALRPWAVRIEQCLKQQLLGEKERSGGYFFAFALEAITRGDLKTQAEYFSTMLQNGAMNRDEVRSKLDMNPMEGDGGDVYTVQMNLKPIGQLGIESELPPEPPEPPPTEEPQPARAECDCGHEHRAPGSPKDAEKRTNRPAIQRSYIRVIRDAMERVMRRERNDIMAAAGKAMRRRGVPELERFIDEFYQGHQEFTRDQITPAFTALAEAVGSSALREINQQWEWTLELQEWLAAYIDAFAQRHSLRSRQQLLDMIAAAVADGDDVLEALTVRFDEWENGRDELAATRAEKIAAENSVRLGQGFAREAFFAAGVLSLVWVATGSETCPYCQALDGRVVGREQVFLSAGDEFAPGGNEPLVPSNDVKHPPAHGGCDCLLIPGV